MRGLMRIRHVLWMGGALLAGRGVALAGDYKPGDRVVVVVDGQLTISGGKVVDDVGPGLVLTVEDVNGEWHWLNNGKPRYLQESKVIPLSRAAIGRLTELLAANPNNDRLYWGRGNVCQERDDLDIALADYNQPIRQASKEAARFNNRGTLWHAYHEYDKAIADFDEAIRLDPKFAYAYNGRGNAWSSKQEYDKAIADFDEAIRLDPKFVTAYINRGLTWQAKEEYDKAIADFDEVIHLDPKSANAYNSRGYTWRLKQEFDKAISDYDEAIHLDPKFANAYYNRGLTWHAKQEYDKAIADYDEVIRLDPKYTYAYNNRGAAWRLKQEYDKAIADYDEAILLDPKNAEVYSNRGYAWNSKQEYVKAIADYDEVIRLDPKNASAYLNRGICRLALRRPAAMDDFQSVLEIDPTSGYCALLGHLAARLMNLPDRAQEFLAEPVSKLTPDWPFPCVQLLKRELDEPGLLKLATTNDQQTEAHCYLGLDQLASGTPETARPHFEWVRDHGKKTFIEYRIAVAELARMDKPQP